MKKYLVIAFVLFFTITLSSNELSWVDTQVDAIKPPRKGMSNSHVTNIKSPFIFLEKNRSEAKKRGKSKKSYATKPKSKSSSKMSASSSSSSKTLASKKAPKGFMLSAIINNSALINGKWYKLNDSIKSYKLSSIDRTSVVLTKGKKKLVLSTSETKPSLKFK